MTHLIQMDFRRELLQNTKRRRGETDRQHAERVFWIRWLLVSGIHPKSPKALTALNAVKQKRKKSLNMNDPVNAITEAPESDRQYHLERFWPELSWPLNALLLHFVWVTKIDGMIYGFDWWLPFFEDVGFISNKNVEVPKEPVTLYRAALPELKRGMSWTPDRKVAEMYKTNHYDPFGERRIYRATVQPDAILGIFSGSMKNVQDFRELTNGSEFVVHHHRLPDEIEEL